MPEIGDKLKAVFGRNRGSPPVAPVKLPPKPKRYIPDISIAIAAQRIYNPDKPPAPATKAPTTQQSKGGTAPNMDLSSKWDRGNV